ARRARRGERPRRPRRHPSRRRGGGGGRERGAHRAAWRGEPRGRVHGAHRPSHRRGGRARRGRDVIVSVGGQLGLAYAFVEREIALSKRYWAWELVWLVYGIVTSLSVAYIGLAAPAIAGASVDEAAISRFVLYPLLGTTTSPLLGSIFVQMVETISLE